MKMKNRNEKWNENKIESTIFNPDNIIVISYGNYWSSWFLLLVYTIGLRSIILLQNARSSNRLPRK